MTRNPNTPDSNNPRSKKRPARVPIGGKDMGARALGAGVSVPALAQSGGTIAPVGQPSRKRFRLRIPTGWQFWAAVTVVISGSLGFAAMGLLLKLPDLPNCPAIYWPMASASMRLYCAQMSANKQTVSGLVQAISLVQGLPEDHPLRAEINRNVEEWSLQILDLAEEGFNTGNLDEAIATAKKIPANVSAYKLVQERISRWQEIWNKADSIYKQAEQKLEELEWHQAFQIAVRLMSVDNKFWSSTKYEELNAKIKVAREDIGKIDKAQELIKSAGLDGLFQALNLAESIGPQSYVYSKAKTVIAQCGTQLLQLAKDNLDRRNWQKVLDIANRLPASLNLQAEAQDLMELARAQARAELGNLASLEAAIAQGQKVDASRPLYSKAQELVARWQREIEDVNHLERARDLAKSGSASDLIAAIAEAQLISPNNPRYREAQQQISSWTSLIETREDSPYLERARSLAKNGDTTALQSAIEEANKINKGRSLYSEARRNIDRWTSQIQRIQDQPILDQAERLASGGNLNEAIATAGQISSSRALYSEAQSRIRGWRREVQGQQQLQTAYQLAKAGTPDSLAAAIKAAQEVPSSSAAGSDARTAISTWSYQILSMAQSKANSNMSEAIAIARNIPSGSDAYNAAQSQIKEWQKAIAPAPSPALSPLSSPPVINTSN